MLVKSQKKLFAFEKAMCLSARLLEARNVTPFQCYTNLDVVLSVLKMYKQTSNMRVWRIQSSKY